MARAECMPNVIADAVAGVLAKIDRDSDAGKWFTSPRVTRGFFVADLVNGARPALRVEVARYDQKMSESLGPRHEGKLSLIVHCISESPAREAEANLNRLCSDVIRAITDNEYLTVDGHRLVLTPEAYAPDIEAMERHQVGIAQVIVRADFEWEHGAP